MCVIWGIKNKCANEVGKWHMRLAVGNNFILMDGAILFLQNNCTETVFINLFNRYADAINIFFLILF